MLKYDYDFANGIYTCFNCGVELDSGSAFISHINENDLVEKFEPQIISQLSFVDPSISNLTKVSDVFGRSDLLILLLIHDHSNQDHSKDVDPEESSCELKISTEVLMIFLRYLVPSFSENFQMLEKFPKELSLYYLTDIRVNIIRSHKKHYIRFFNQPPYSCRDLWDFFNNLQIRISSCSKVAFLLQGLSPTFVEHLSFFSSQNFCILYSGDIFTIFLIYGKAYYDEACMMIHQFFENNVERFCPSCQSCYTKQSYVPSDEKHKHDIESSEIKGAITEISGSKARQNDH